MIEITILGCGSSTGVPVIGCDCHVCKSDNPHNKRARSSILIKSKNTTILVDCGFDIRYQLLSQNVKNIDAVILTHCHADHIMGLDHLRIFATRQNKPIPVYTDVTTIVSCTHMFAYMIILNQVEFHKVNMYDKRYINDIEIQFFKQIHAEVDSLGLRIKDFIYANDVGDFPKNSEQFLYNASDLVVDCKEYEDTKIHAGLSSVMKWYEKYKPKNVYMTNLSHKMEYETLNKETPQNFLPCYDGLKINI